ncbi:thiamine pyrophosphate-dependent dehydrogenase E1 component subunit alpha [Frankia sp. B2]|uniref:thiamine pyrophosphate-dependent enzyme n=1 Tax=Frankia sp. B2 TaxID=2541730 RepID=UPI00106B5F68|nr:thiamine pyrophosphate-dependent enzyme [Frankia sp. B2]TFE33800.1 thiamine pyrophosphate-dependent dehydrogenase E1 component subunit alpha [Frankia sp. B2]
MNVVRDPELITGGPMRRLEPDSVDGLAPHRFPGAFGENTSPAAGELNDGGIRLLAPDGSLVADSRFSVLADHELRMEFYTSMVLARRLDEEATALQRQGELVLWIPLRGQEAAQVGSAAAARPRDYLFPSYREHAVAWHRGVPAVEVIRLLRGVSHDGWDTHRHNMANYTIVLAAQTLHAVGFGMGVLLDGAAGTGTGTGTGTGGTGGTGTDTDTDMAVMVYLGDGAMSQGDANEAFVWAASFGAPIVFFCQNNQWAISTPSRRQSPVRLARRADGFGFPGLRVDGNDVLAVHAVTTWALDRARSGRGPVLIEANTYRMAPHTTSDDATRYQPPDEITAWQARDPIERLRRLLAAEVEAGWFDEVRRRADVAAADLRRDTLALDPPDPSSMLDHVAAEETADQRRQREWFAAYRDSFL